MPIPSEDPHPHAWKPELARDIVKFLGTAMAHRYGDNPLVSGHVDQAVEQFIRVYDEISAGRTDIDTMRRQLEEMIQLENQDRKRAAELESEAGALSGEAAAEALAIDRAPEEPAKPALTREERKAKALAQREANAAHASAEAEPPQAPPRPRLGVAEEGAAESE